MGVEGIGSRGKPTYPVSGPLAAGKICFRKAFDFRGRAPRSEVWWFVALFYLACIALFAVVALLIAIGVRLSEHRQPMLDAFYLVVALFTLPMISVAVRRLHDCGKTGYWVFAYLIMQILPVVLLWQFQGAQIILFAIVAMMMISTFLYLFLLASFFRPGTIGENRYGPEPY